MSGANELRSRVRAHGKRVTPQRQLVLDAIRAAGGHVTTNEIFTHVSAAASSVNRTTVYRNLDFLCEMRLVVAAQIGGKMYYEIAGEEPHHHLVCRHCDSVGEISHRTVKALFDKIEREQSFVVDMDHLALFGLCAECRHTVSKPKLRTRRKRGG
ncbi:MAG: transcriptional repressor [Chloroflexi bacterium]|nr:transcriptional repressor [Chloroflexota bacterium]